LKFSDLKISKPLLNAINDIGFVTPTTIQERAFPIIMSGKDIVGIAQTGTGKTLAFLLPCLQQWNYSKVKSPQILIIVPTRELVMQIVNEVNKLTKYMNVITVGIYGGANIKTQSKTVYNGVDVLVATPGRLYDIAMLGVLRFKNIKTLIIDEIDEMLNLGFRHQLINNIELLPKKRQNLMFSATLTKDVENFINEYFYNPLKIEAAPSGTPLKDIEQIKYNTKNYYTKVNLLKWLLLENREFDKVLIFTSTKKLADQLFEDIKDNFVDKIGVIHSNKSQNNRFGTVNKFHNGTYKIVIATDIVARGIDISKVSHVINFDTPEIPENYIHRIGRTGRADKKGKAILFVTEKDLIKINNIEGMMNMEIKSEPFPIDNVEISEELTLDEMPVDDMKEVFVKTLKEEKSGPAFHEKLEKNKKTRIKVTRAQQMKKKYKKPKTRGQKRK
jgi:ATP-dependent RNA helicase RhlE